jgi:hypothetical protein
MVPMRLGFGGTRSGNGPPQESMRQTMAGATMFSVAIGVAAIGAGLSWISNDGGGGADETAAPSGVSAVVNENRERAEIGPSQPAGVVSFSPSGQIIRQVPLTARIIDPETGEEVLVPLPTGFTVDDGEVVPIGPGTTVRPGSPTTGPGTGTTGTTSQPPTTSPTTKPPTTQPPTTEPPTTEPPTTEPPTTEPPTTEPPTTEPPTTEGPPPPPPAGGLLGGVVDLLGG